MPTLILRSRLINMNEVFLSAYNKKFAKPALEPQDHHKKLSPKINLADVFSCHQSRVVQNDWSIQYKNRILQLEYKQPCRITPCRRVTVAGWIGGTIFMIYDKNKLNFTGPCKKKRDISMLDKKRTLLFWFDRKLCYN